jgi:hypothetical protein
MADYLAVPDDYAGWNPTGRSFACIGGGIAAVGLLCWFALHGRLGTYRPTAAADQMLLEAFVYAGGGGFVLMLIAAFGSISLSLKARGSVHVTENGVTRVVGNKTCSLAWEEMEGFVVSPYGGVTLISTSSQHNIVIPRFLDDYRACIAEIKQHGLHSLPPGRLTPNRVKTRWIQVWAISSASFFFIDALDPQHSHRIRISFLCAAATIMICILYRADLRADSHTPRWLEAIGISALLLWAVWRIAHTW